MGPFIGPFTKFPHKKRPFHKITFLKNGSFTKLCLLEYFMQMSKCLKTYKKLLTHTCSGFILGRLYGVCHPICPFDKKNFIPLPFDSVSARSIFLFAYWRKRYLKFLNNKQHFLHQKTIFNRFNSAYIGWLFSWLH